MKEIDKNAMHLIQCFTDYKPKEGADVIRYIYKARELANCYDKLTECEDEEEADMIVLFMQYLLKANPLPLDIDFHIEHF